jgi:Zn finger protein HypA/HybF involved in hydrogenase expression
MTPEADFLPDSLTPYLIIFFTASFFYARWKRRRQSPDITGSSILLGFYTHGVEMIPVKKGVIGNLSYSAIALLEKPGNMIADVHSGLLYRVELPFESNVHLLGIPKNSGSVPLSPHGGVMEPVHLEGNYSKYFGLYAEKQMQSQSRYVLDPSGMVFTLDFCQSHSWEIVGNELYFVQTSANQADDKTTVEQDIERFVKEIEPAISRPLTESAIRLRRSYGEDTRTEMKCPNCSELLEKQPDYLSCPKQHGLLVKVSALPKVNIVKILPHQLSTGQVTKRPTDILCPHCDSPMTQSGYNGSQTMIDVCLKCPYRWFDAGEYRA